MNKSSLTIAQLAGLIALILVIQMMGLPQPVTGPLINAMLFIATALLGPLAGIILGTMSPIVALIRGQLPAMLAPMLPFIILGNASLVLIYSLVCNKWLVRIQKLLSIYIAILLAAIVKFLILLLSVRLLIPLIIGHRFPPKIELAMAFPQFLTAIGGGIIFLILFRFLKKWAGFEIEDLPKE